jgi:hypothetical protein
MCSGWLNVGDRIVMKQVEFQVFEILDKYVLISLKSPLQYYSFDFLTELNEFAFSSKR